MLPLDYYLLPHMVEQPFLWFKLEAIECNDIYLEIYKRCDICQQEFKDKDFIFKFIKGPSVCHIECYKDSMNYKIHNIPFCSKLITNYKTLGINIIEHIQNNVFPNLIARKFRYKTKCIEYNIGDLDYDKLKLCCQQRDLPIFKIKSQNESPYLLSFSELKSKLYEFFKQNEMIKNTELLVLGHIKEIQKKYRHIMIPTYLAKIILKYSPTFIFIPDD